MNALAANQEFAVVQAPATQWLVLRCPSSRTISIARQLADRGAWTPTWKRKRRLPRANIARLIDEACIPSFVFIPEVTSHNLPPMLPCSLMHDFDGVLVRVPDRQLEPLRKIAERPAIKASELPKPGMTVRFTGNAFGGLTGKVLECTHRYATVLVEGFPQPMQIATCLLLK